MRGLLSRLFKTKAAKRAEEFIASQQYMRDEMDSEPIYSNSYPKDEEI